jgi:hypothetical protein
MPIQDELTYIGLTEIDNITKTFGILPDDRRRHMYIIGKSGVGKSTLIENLALQDIYAGKGVAFIDPLGDSAESIIDRIPPYRQQDVIYLDPADTDFPIGINIMQAQNGEPNFLIASELIQVFKKTWANSFSARMEYFLTNAVLALLEMPGNTLIGIGKIFTDKLFRKYIVENCKNPLVKSFWENEYPNFAEGYRNEAAGAIVNKINQFLSNEMMRNIVGQQYSTINFRKIMDEGKILIVNLSKGRMGEYNARMLGTLLVTKLQMAAMSRVDIPEGERKDFYMYVDEFHNIVSESFATILSEARKYRLNLILAHQYMGQLQDEENRIVRDAIFGNVGSIIAFQTGYEDAEYLEKVFFSKIEKGTGISHFLNLDRAQVLVKLYVQSKTLNAFSATTMPPLYLEFVGKKDIVRNFSRKNYAKRKEEVDKQIYEYFEQSLIIDDDGKTIRAKAPKRKRNRKKKEKVVEEYVSSEVENEG